MAKIVSTTLQDVLNLHVQCHVENKEYEEFSQRLTQQYLKNVEVKGFRKGKAPADLALKQADPVKLNQLVLEEAVQRFYKDLQPEVTQYLKKEDRIPANIPAQVDPESVKLEDDGFHFKVIITLLPKIDLSKLDGLQVSTPDLSEAGERLSFEEFQGREEEKILVNLNEFEPSKNKSKNGYQLVTDIIESVEDGETTENKDIKILLGGGQFPPEFDAHLLDSKVGETKDFVLNLPHGDHNHNYTFKVTIKEVNQPKYKTVDEIFENVEDAKKQFADKEAFLTFLHSIYDQETESILATLKRRELIRNIIEQTPDFDLPEAQMEVESNRILEELKHRAEHSKQDLSDVFAVSGLPDADKGLKKEADIVKAVKDYVYKEFKLVEILRAIYQVKIDDKISEAEIKKAADEMKKDPEKYNVAKSEMEENRIMDLAFDRLLRNKSFQWVYDRATFVDGKKPAKKSAKPDTAKKPAKAKK